MVHLDKEKEGKEGYESISKWKKWAWEKMAAVRAMATLYDEQKAVCKYVHSTSRGHEAIQLAMAACLTEKDFVSPYYRDEAMLLGLGFTPYELMLQLLAKKDDPFSGGRTYYSHPSWRGAGKPTIIHQSSATGMQAIPASGIGFALAFKEKYLTVAPQETETAHPEKKALQNPIHPIAVCSLGDSSVTEGEVSEAFQFACLHKLPLLFLVQDNEWGISVRAEESRTNNAYEYAKGFQGMTAITVDGTQFSTCLTVLQDAVMQLRLGGGPILVHARVPLLGHHTSGVRKEFYRDQEEFDRSSKMDPFFQLQNELLQEGVSQTELDNMVAVVQASVKEDFERAKEAAEPNPESVLDFVFAPPAVLIEKGDRRPLGRSPIPMVDAALFAIREILEDFPEALLYGQDVGKRLGGVFREAATLGEQFGDHRVFNTAIQEAQIIGSTAGMSAVGLKPIVEVQFGDYLYPALNQLVGEIAKSSYLTNGKFPVQTLIRVPVGAYGGGGPYHSGSVESTLLTIKGIKVVYPSNAADMKGLMRSAFLDPNPVLMLEHKGLYWSKVPGTEEAKQPEPERGYVVPMGVGNVVYSAQEQQVRAGNSAAIITYGMGVHKALQVARKMQGRVEVVDLRSLYPLDENLLEITVRKHGKCLIFTEEPVENSFAEALAGRLTAKHFSQLDAPIKAVGAPSVPAVPLNIHLEAAVIPSVEKLSAEMETLLRY
jgi:2-oxoisovalerate dehydrogenase E1 component